MLSFAISILLLSLHRVHPQLLNPRRSLGLHNATYFQPRPEGIRTLHDRQYHDTQPRNGIRPPGNGRSTDVDVVGPAYNGGSRRLPEQFIAEPREGAAYPGYKLHSGQQNPPSMYQQNTHAQRQYLDPVKAQAKTGYDVLQGLDAYDYDDRKQGLGLALKEGRQGSNPPPPPSSNGDKDEGKEGEEDKKGGDKIPYFIAGGILGFFFLIFLLLSYCLLISFIGYIYYCCCCKKKTDSCCPSDTCSVKDCCCSPSGHQFFPCSPMTRNYGGDTRDTRDILPYRRKSEMYQDHSRIIPSRDGVSSYASRSPSRRPRSRLQWRPPSDAEPRGPYPREMFPDGMSPNIRLPSGTSCSKVDDPKFQRQTRPYEACSSASRSQENLNPKV